MNAILRDTIRTERLDLEPVSARLAQAAALGPEVFARELGAEVAPEWARSGLRLAARSATPSDPARAPVRAVMILRSENLVVGDVRFEPVTPGAETREIGYSVAPPWRRRGLATEGAGAVLDWLFEEAGARRALAGCDLGNRASVRTLRKLGFWLDGAAAGAFWWVITSELRRGARA